MTIYDVQNAQKTPIWKQQIIECRSSGMSVKEWCKERGLDFTTYYRWERKILTSIIPTEDMPGLPLRIFLLLLARRTPLSRLSLHQSQKIRKQSGFP